ncbi:nuclear transport factor 2 family protein [Kitasatospora cineracea]|uniref:nuclear transport factor 2 family protein n=1 Tax=Kitasatospora cineracea TaxID=88074 RepID=UPI00382646D2
MDLQHLAERYLAAWNETDPAARRKLVEETWSADGRYTDPLVETRGHEQFDAALAAVQAQFAGLVFRLGPVDAHHDVARFTWELAPEGAAEPLVVGFDVLTAAADGRIATVVGFLDKVPAA